MSKLNKKSLAVALGTVVVGSLSTVSIAQAEANPFGISELSNGYMRVAEAAAKEAQCGEGKCGGDKMKKAVSEGKCAGLKTDDAIKKSAHGKKDSHADKSAHGKKEAHGKKKQGPVVIKGLDSKKPDQRSQHSGDMKGEGMGGMKTVYQSFLFLRIIKFLTC